MASKKVTIGSVDIWHNNSGAVHARLHGPGSQVAMHPAQAEAVAAVLIEHARLARGKAPVAKRPSGLYCMRCAREVLTPIGHGMEPTCECGAGVELPMSVTSSLIDAKSSSASRLRNRSVER